MRPIFHRRDLIFLNNLCLDVSYGAIGTHRELVAGGNPLERAFALTGLLPLNAADLYQTHPGRFVVFQSPCGGSLADAPTRKEEIDFAKGGSFISH